MAYTDYVSTTPDPTTQTPGQAFTSDLNNQLALRDALIGGAGGEVARALEEIGSSTRLVRLGIPDRFIDHGDQALLLAEVGLDRNGIIRSAREHTATDPSRRIAANE